MPQKASRHRSKTQLEGGFRGGQEIAEGILHPIWLGNTLGFPLEKQKKCCWEDTLMDGWMDGVTRLSSGKKTFEIYLQQRLLRKVSNHRPIHDTRSE